MKHVTENLLLEVCWLAGVKSYYNGLEEAENPYPAHTREADFWIDGWWEACLDEGKLSESLLHETIESITAQNLSFAK